jgi:hypothetical protein
MIKQLSKLSIILLVLVASFSSCKKDEDAVRENSFSYNGENFSITNGFFKDYGANDAESADFDIYFTSGITKDGSSLTGTGDIVYLDLNSPNLDEIASGTYTWTDGARAANTIVSGYVGMDYDYDLESGTNYDLVGGTVKISVSDSNYEIEYTLELTNGETVTGYYNGSLVELTSSLKEGKK